MLCHLGITYKCASRDHVTQPVDPAHAFFGADIDWDKAIAIDETCFYINDPMRRGWSPSGKRVPKRKALSRRKISVLLAVDSSGVISYVSKAGNINSTDFAAFIGRIPRSRQLILDNVSFHRSKVVSDAASERDIELVFTPPYSPWFNPTEYAFSLAKKSYRAKCEHSAGRTLDGALKDIADVFACDIGSMVRVFQHVRQLRARIKNSFS
jgi:transposase